MGKRKIPICTTNDVRHHLKFRSNLVETNNNSSVNELDMALLAGDFFHGVLPPDRQYLRNHFKGKIELCLVSYYCLFSKLKKQHTLNRFTKCFWDHSGLHCSESHVRVTVHKIEALERAIQDARCKSDLAALAQLKLGQPG